MIRIIKGRDTGKTRELMEECAKNHGTFVCLNPHRMIEKSRAYGLTGFDIISYYDYIDNPSKKDSKYYIDELEEFIYTVSNGDNLSGYTISLE